MPTATVLDAAAWLASARVDSIDAYAAALGYFNLHHSCSEVGFSAALTFGYPSTNADSEPRSVRQLPSATA
eukprot:14794031-Alexandrium_andersonii.AAC.1